MPVHAVQPRFVRNCCAQAGKTTQDITMGNLPPCCDNTGTSAPSKSDSTEHTTPTAPETEEGTETPSGAGRGGEGSQDDGPVDYQSV
eukprot:COSAG01_NODE_725_length_14049_cov_7.712760_13_plen_87_part_00